MTERPAPSTHYGIGSVGDLWVAARPDEKMALALQVIATHLHQEYDKGWSHPNAFMAPDKSKESCILASATVRDFLFRIGYRDAKVVPVVFWIDAHDAQGEMVKALGIGNPDGPDNGRRPDRFNGHTVVLVDGWLIDTTLYQATPRPAWPNFPQMFATPVFPSGEKGAEWWGLNAISAHGMIEATTGHHIQWGWLDQPGNQEWRDAPDFREKWRRERVVDALVKAFKAGG